jgi:hypothetical protein
MTVSCRSGDEQSSGLEITITLTALETEAMGQDATLMAEIFDSYLWALGMLRTGPNSRDPGTPAPTPGDWVAALRGLDRLPPRLKGVRDGLIRAYTAAGGSLARMATAMNISTPAARHRRTRITRHSPETWEEWARTRSSRP